MEPIEFCRWLQGFFEIHKSRGGAMTVAPALDSHTVRLIEEHLQLVFRKVTTDKYLTPNPQKCYPYREDGTPKPIEIVC